MKFGKRDSSPSNGHATREPALDLPPVMPERPVRTAPQGA